MGWVLTALWLALHPTPEQSSRFQATAPQLTVAQASEHLQAARVVALATQTDPYLLLYIARHESGYNPKTMTPEAGGKHSCGVMTPVPMRHCRPGTLTQQYAAGAKNLVDWRGICGGDERCVILGYAGGVPLIRACRGRTMWRRRGKRRVDLCQTHRLYLGGAQEIRDAVEGP